MPRNARTAAQTGLQRGFQGGQDHMKQAIPLGGPAPQAARSAAATAARTRCRRVFQMMAATSVVALGACSIVEPEPLTDTQVETQVQKDLDRMFADQEPVSGPITLYEAMARAIKYNLDHRLKVMEAALATRRLTSAHLDMLPTLAANAGYVGRSNVLASNSESILTGAESLEVSTSQDKNVGTADLSLTWNVLDFGVSYMRAKQEADRTLILEERRRKVVQNIIQEVRTAYWQAVSADRLLNRTAPLMERVTRALAQAREIEARRLQPPIEVLTYRRDLLGIVRQLSSLRRQLASAKARIAALMNLPVSSDFRLADMDGGRAVPDVALPVADLERLALVRRPELHEEIYQERISRNEVTRAMLDLLPGIELDVGWNYTSNSFTLNNRWWDWGASIAGNLLDVVTLPTRLDAAEAQIEVVSTRRMALAMAVMTQVRVS